LTNNGGDRILVPARVSSLATRSGKHESRKITVKIGNSVERVREILRSGIQTTENQHHEALISAVAQVLVGAFLDPPIYDSAEDAAQQVCVYVREILPLLVSESGG